jgi:uncharacterized protein YjiS (DUF1127 family)
MAIRSILAPHALQAHNDRGSGWFAGLRRALQAIESRRHLAEMDRRMLADIGLSRAEALEEARRAPWDLAARRG